MSKRLELHEILVDVLGSRNVYFQPPETVKMKYPCIVYGLENSRSVYADDDLYMINKSYSVTIIDSDPDSLIPDKLQLLPYCRYSRHFSNDNLNHYVFTIYY